MTIDLDDDDKDALVELLREDAARPLPAAAAGEAVARHPREARRRVGAGDALRCAAAAGGAQYGAEEGSRRCPRPASLFSRLLGQIAKHDLQLPSSGANLRCEIFVRLIVFDAHARVDEVPPFPKVLRDVNVAQT